MKEDFKTYKPTKREHEMKNFNETNTFILDNEVRMPVYDVATNKIIMILSQYAVWTTLNNLKPGRYQVIECGNNLDELKIKYNTSRIMKQSY